MAAPIIAVPESVKAAQLASIEKLGKRLQDSKPPESCSIDLVPEAFNCAVCHDLFIKPRQCFPCRHSFCESCLRQVANSEIHRDTGHCPCPLCRRPIHYSCPDKSLEAEIMRSSFVNLYADGSESYARNSALQAKPLPGLALLSFLPSISPSYGRINRVLSFIAFALLWLSAKSTRSLLLDWFFVRTLQSWLVLLLVSYAAVLICTISMIPRIFIRPETIRFVELGADYCSARRILPDTCPVPNFPDPLEVRVQVRRHALPLEVDVIGALCGLMICASCGPLLRRYGGCLRLGNAVSFVGVGGTCACALFSLLRGLTLVLVALILRY